MIQPNAALTQVLQDQVQDADSDRDGVPDDVDECPETYRSPVDHSGCSLGDLCPCTNPWKNDGEYVSCVAKTSQKFVKAGLLTNKQRSDHVSNAAKEGCIRPPGVSACGYYDDCLLGTPGKLNRSNASDSLEIVFAVAGDPQFHQPYETFTTAPSDKLLRQQLTTEAIHVACRDADPPCAGVVVVGDLTQESTCKQLLAFRQLYEWGYKGSYEGCAVEWCNFNDSLYSWGYMLNRPMYPLWGNHDNPDWKDTRVAGYIRDLVKDSPALYDSPIELKAIGIDADSWFYEAKYLDIGFYAWEWGNFHFISLGLWAFYDGGVGDSVYDQRKVQWLKDHLHSVGHEKSIVLFQHYGFDQCYDSGCSFEQKEQRWWTWENAWQLINVFCNRDNSYEPCGTPDKPRYNVAGIFTGHVHANGFCRIYPEKDGGNFESWNDATRCQKNVDDDESAIYFDNFQVNDGGESDNPGYTMVRLNAWPMDVRPDDSYAGTITVQGFELRDWDYDFDNYDWLFNCKYINKSDYILYPKLRYQNPISTTFLTFQQGEPNGGRTENCAEFLTNGRMNDVPCDYQKHAACYNELDGVWTLTPKKVVWKGGSGWCRQLGSQYKYATPQDLEQQAKLLNLVVTTVNEQVWVNYTDLGLEGRWEAVPWTFTLFDVGEPNGGRTENCAEFLTNGRMNDVPCDYQKHAACYNDSSGVWTLTPERHDWDSGFVACMNLGSQYKFGIPQNLEQQAELLNLVVTSVNEQVWVNYTDIFLEGHWKVFGDN